MGRSLIRKKGLSAEYSMPFAPWSVMRRTSQRYYNTLACHSGWFFVNSVYADIPEALQLLRERGARLFVATSKPQVYAQRILDHFVLSHYFDEV